MTAGKKLVTSLVVTALVLAAIVAARPLIGSTGAATAERCPDSLHAKYRGWHPPVDPATGCTFGHEHGDNPDPYGYFKQAGVPDIEFEPLHHLTMDHDGHEEAHAGFKVQYLDGGTPKDPSDDLRTVYHQISSARNTAHFYEKFVRDRDPRTASLAFHSAQVQVLARGQGGKLVYTDVKWVDKIADLHPRPSKGSLIDEAKLVQLYRTNHDAAVKQIRDNTRKESWYWADWVNNRKEGLPLPLWEYILVDRVLDGPTYEAPDGKDRMTDYYTCEAHGYDKADDRCNADGNLRFTDKMAFRVTASKPGIYWTDIYGKKVYGSGAQAPAACAKETCVRQIIGAMVKREYIGPNGLMGPDRLMWYEAPGIVWPN